MSPRPIIAQCIECPINDFGGVEVLVRKLVEGLSQQYRIVLVSGDKPGALEGTAIGSLIEKHIPAPPPRAATARYVELANDLKASGVTLAHFHLGGNYWWGSRSLNRSAMIHAHQAGIRVLTTNHGVFSLFDFCASYRPLWMKLAGLPLAWMSKVHAVSHCLAEIAVSKNDLNWLRSWYWPVKDKFRVIYHSKLNEEPPAPVAGRKPVILYVGTIGHRKGHLFLVKAFAQIAQRFPEWQLMLAGRPAVAELYQQILEIRKASGLEDRIELNDQLSDACVSERMRASAIFVMPSLQEGLGLSLQEALYRGCACVASRAGGMRDLIEHNVNGLQFAPGDVDELADLLEKLITDTTLRERLSQAARPSVLAKGMTAPLMVQNYMEVYDSILGKR